MPFQYTNRRGDVYHLQSKPDRKGKARYSFTRKLTGTPVDQLPDGYEARELPDIAQVVLRKIQPSDILATEKAMAESAVRHQAGLEHFIVDVDGNDIVIWLPGTDIDSAVERIAGGLGIFSFNVNRYRERMIRDAHYTRMMRFVLADAGKRTFDVQRWCFLGSIDKWVYLDGSKPLAELLKKYARHLGKESFYDLMQGL